MCITNQFSEETLKSIRKIEVSAEDCSDRELCDALVRIKKITEDLDWGKEKIQKILKERNFQGIEIFPELESKVYLTEGRSFSEISVEGVKKGLEEKGLGEIFPTICSVVVSKIKNIEETLIPQVEQIVDTNKTITVGEPSITVRKMSKKELKESL
jgi:hypothetical protein